MGNNLSGNCDILCLSCMNIYLGAVTNNSDADTTDGLIIRAAVSNQLNSMLLTELMVEEEAK